MGTFFAQVQEEECAAQEVVKTGEGAEGEAAPGTEATEASAGSPPKDGEAPKKDDKGKEQAAASKKPATEKKQPEKK